MSGSKWTIIRDQSILAIIVTVLLIAASVGLSEIQTLVGWKVVLLTLGAMWLFLLVLAGVVIKHVQVPVESATRRVEDIFKQCVDLTTLRWLRTSRTLAAEELASTAKQIWVITADLLEDVPGGLFFNVVESRLTRGAEYLFLVPNRPEMRTRVEEMIQGHQRHRGVRVVYLPEEAFMLVPRWDVIIYNPLRCAEDVERVGYMEIPADGGDERFLARMRDEFTDLVVGKLLPHIGGGQDGIGKSQSSQT